MTTSFDITEGWLDWIISSPGGDYPIQIMRREWARPHVIYARDMNPETNSVGLYWRPTGIYKHFMSELPVWSQLNNAYGNFGMGSLLSGMLGSYAYSGPVDFDFWPDGSV